MHFHRSGIGGMFQRVFQHSVHQPFQFLAVAGQFQRRLQIRRQPETLAAGQDAQCRDPAIEEFRQLDLFAPPQQTPILRLRQLG